MKRDFQSKNLTCKQHGKHSEQKKDIHDEPTANQTIYMLNFVVITIQFMWLKISDDNATEILLCY